MLKVFRVLSFCQEQMDSTHVIYGYMASEPGAYEISHKVKNVLELSTFKYFPH